MKLGFYLIGPGSYAHVPWDVGVEEVARAGFETIDVSASAGVRSADSSPFPAGLRSELRTLTARHGMAVSAVVTHLGLADTLQACTPLDLRGAVAVARDLGAPLVTLHIGGHARPPLTEAELWDRAVSHVADAADEAAGEGISVCLDAVAPDFLTADPAAVDRFLGEVDRPNVGWNFDPAYLATCGFDLPGAVELLGPWIRHAHIKDYRGDYASVDWLIPGDGMLDHGAYVRLLAGIGYEGALSSEVIARWRDGPERWPLRVAAERSIATFRAALATARSGQVS